MVNRIIKFLLDIIKDLLYLYLYVLLYPIKVIRIYLLNSNGLILVKSILIYWFLVPILNILFYLLYLLIVKPIKNLYLNYVVSELYNSPMFYKELEKPDLLLCTKQNLYRYLLFNSKLFFKFPNPESNQDDLYTYLMYIRRIISPGWRQHHLHFYHEDLKVYRDEMYENTIKVLVRKAAEAKIFDGFNICKDNFILLYKYIYSSFVSNLYELMCYSLYVCNVSQYNIPKYLYILIYRVLYYLIQFSIMISFLFINLFFLPNFFKAFLEILSLNETGTERSMFYSKRFGFSGNLYLEQSYFLKEWNINLTKSSDLGKDSLLKEYTFYNDFPDREGMGFDSIRKFYKDRRYNDLANYSFYNNYTSDQLDFSKFHKNNDSLGFGVQLQQRYMNNTSVFRNKLHPNYSSNSLIHKTILRKFYNCFNFYYYLYSILGRFSYLIMKFVNKFFLYPISSTERKSILTGKLQPMSLDFNRSYLFFLFFILIESTIFILHTLTY